MLWYVERNEIMGVMGFCCGEQIPINVMFFFFVTTYIRNVMYCFFLKRSFFLLHYVSYQKLKQSKVGNQTNSAYIYVISLVIN